jgi:hypothetical protein
VELQFSHFAGSDNIEKAVCQVFDDAENVLGRAIIERFSSLLACSEFGLTEMELLELMLPASHANGTPALMQEGQCNFSGLCALRSTLGKSPLAMMRHLSFLSETLHFSLSLTPRSNTLLPFSGACVIDTDGKIHLSPLRLLYSPV